ncbi:thioredoxin fold domain-containing protein [Neptuniibacter sp. CAU 1671]|uniref:thioredoxin family protein n=1 Tax=Neptuniibacter sp. CAU 1671 TaxID=3032593 RepID=UPI0023DA14A1|nr:thioredoxin fold domain-containing protein [Neptuniibacter sp. CAU 1671]MDF2182884.1 thioredoxin fold domain-containing protein [Neptuniibacter sp. CAU 1671]
MRCSHLLLTVNLLLACFSVQADIPLARDLSEQSAAISEADDIDKVLLILVSQPECAYCIQLSYDLLQPMQRNQQYTNRVRFRRIEMNTHQELTDFDGQTVTANAFAKRFKIGVTPTLLFLDHKGAPLTAALEGYTTPELFGFYLDEAIETSWQQLQNQKD